MTAFSQTFSPPATPQDPVTHDLHGTMLGLILMNGWKTKKTSRSLTGRVVSTISFYAWLADEHAPRH
ncbi:MAG: hypothetical protein R3B47_21410 [Bacteroidia bacterium]